MSGGDKKYGRNIEGCKVYQIQDRRRKNKRRRLLTTLKRQPDNCQIPKALGRLNVASETIENAIIEGLNRQSRKRA